jgi:virginiamycin B lyase
MKRNKSNIGISGPGLVVMSLWAAFTILVVAGCSGPAAPTSLPMPVAEATSMPTLEPAPTDTAEAISPSPDNSPTASMPTTDTSLESSVTSTEAESEPAMQAFPVPEGSHPHDAAPALDGGVWYTAQGSGELRWLDPDTGETRHTPLGSGSRPHGVIVGPDGAPWVTDGGLNAIVRVDPAALTVDDYPLPPERSNANLNTAAFDGDGNLWFTGQNGVYGKLDPSTGEMEVFDAPRGRGPYGIAATPEGDVYYASLAGGYVGHINLQTGEATVLEPPTPDQGARRVWSDSQSRIWVSEWNAGQVAVYDPSDGSWREWEVPGPGARPYAVYVDENDLVWLSDFGSNAVVSFDPTTEEFKAFDLPSSPSNVRQILGRPGEVWLPESAADQLVVIRTDIE